MENTQISETPANQDHYQFQGEPQMPTLNSHSGPFKDQSDEITDSKATNEMLNKKIETNSEDSGSNINNEDSETKNASANEEEFAPEYKSISKTEHISPSENFDLNESEYEEDEDDESVEAEEKNIEKQEESLNNNEILVNSQLEFLQNNTDLLNSPDFLSANLTTKIYLINKAVSENEALKINNINVSYNQRRKRDHSSTYHSNETLSDNPYEQNISSDSLAKLYDEYLQEEAKGGREFYPRNSRLFIANLPLNNVTKKNLFQIFQIYGKILQINIKNNFGFIQYDSAAAVANAIRYESKRDNFGRKLVLEISNSTARPQYDHGDHGKNSSSTFVSSFKRFKNGELVKPSGDNNASEKSIHIIVKQQSDRSAANKLFEYLSRNRGWMISMTFLNTGDDIKKTIKKSADENFNGCAILKSYMVIDAIVFAKDNEGKSTFNEYTNVDKRDLIKLFGGYQNNHNNNQSYNKQYNNNHHNNYHNNNNYHQQPQQNFPGMVTPNMAPLPNYNQMVPQQQYMNQSPMPMMNMGYPTMPMQQPMGQSSTMMNTGNNNNNVDLLSQVQNLPPDVLKNLLANAQKQTSPTNNINTSVPQQNVDSNRPQGNDVLELLNNLTKK
ncbi:hypothetical protein FOG48_04137 [Hanseniaspora uvarum]|nr:hypothetical protein FOG48_04137 [Hanseniaspora uvarum]